MDDFPIKGVKSRVRFSKGDNPTPPEQVQRQGDASMSRFATESGAGVGVWALSIETPDTRMSLFVGTGKGTFLRRGYYRYTQGMAPIISEKRYLGALVNPQGNLVWKRHLKGGRACDVQRQHE